MALSLAACGSSSTTTTTTDTTTDTTTTTPAVDAAKTLALSTAADNLVGGSGDDTFNGSVSATAAENTLNNTDLMDGGAGADTLNVVANVLAIDIAATAVGMSNIETVNIKAVDGDGTVGIHAATFNASLTSGVTAVNATGNSNVTVTGLAAGASVGLVGNGTVVNGILSYAYATATSAQVINIDGGTLNTGVANITATASAGVTTATINSTGAANKVDTIKLDSAGGKTVTSLTVNADAGLTATLTAADFATTATIDINGAGAVDLGSNANVKTIDASGNSGGVTIAAGSNTTSLTGGSGNDVITSAAVGTTAAINAGAGTDTLVIGTNVAHVDTAAEAGRYSNFETLRMNGTLDVSLVSGITAIELSGATNSLSKMSAEQAGAVTARADIGASGFALASSTGTSDVLSLTMGTGSKATEATDMGALTANGFETINITTNAGPTANEAGKLTEIASFSADKVTAINLYGTSVDIANAATTKAVTIDATGLTGDGGTTSNDGLLLSGNLVVGSTVKGSGVVDTIDLGTVGSTYQGNAGNDAFNATAVTQLESGSVWNTIDGGDGSDTVKVTANAVTLADTNFARMSNMEKLTVDADGAAGAVSVTTGGFFNSNFTDATVTLLGADTDTITYSGATYTGDATIKVTSAGLGDAAGEDISVTTGAGADTVTVTASSWVGTAAASSGIAISTGDGADTIALTTGNLLATTAGVLSITAGKGADTITKTGTNDTTATALVKFVIADGDSTVAARDKITGFDKGDGTDRSDVLDLSTGTAQGNTAGTDGTDAGTIKSHAITSGIITFDDVNTFATALTINEANLSDVTTYLAANIDSGKAVAFAYDSNSDGTADATMVFANGTLDTLVELVGVTGATAIGASAVTADLIAIA